MSTLVLLFFGWYSSVVQVTMATIISWMSSNFGQIRPLIAESAVLEFMENCYLVLWPT